MHNQYDYYEVKAYKEGQVEVLDKVNVAFKDAVKKLKENHQHFQYKRLVNMRVYIEQRLDELALVYSVIFDISVNKAKELLLIEESV